MRARAGFTLIELMITVVILAILVSIAIPAYQRYVYDSRRTEGRDVLLKTAQHLERCYSTYGSYNNNGCDLVSSGSLNVPIDSESGYYTITAANSTVSANGFDLSAKPQKAQASDKCKNLTLDETGRKGTSSSLDTSECW